MNFYINFQNNDNSIKQQRRCLNLFVNFWCFHVLTFSKFNFNCDQKAKKNDEKCEWNKKKESKMNKLFKDLWLHSVTYEQKKIATFDF